MGSHTCLGYESEIGGGRMVIFDDNSINNHINEKVSSRALHIGMVFHTGTFKNDQFTKFPRPSHRQQGVSFYCEGCAMLQRSWIDAQSLKPHQGK